MASQGRGIAPRAGVVAVALLLCLLDQFEIARAASLTVGDRKGWTFNVDTWTNGKKFKAGDVLVFKYDASIHNVVAVDSSSYRSCTVPANPKSYTSGNDRIILSKGQNYFICSFPGHCDGGIKIAVNAS